MRITTWKREVRTMLNDGEMWVDLDSTRGRRVRCDAIYPGQNPTKICIGEYLECGRDTSHGYCEECANEYTIKTGKSEPNGSKHKRQKTMERLERIGEEDRVERISYIWNCAWRRQKRENREVAAHCATFRAFSDRTPEQFHSNQEIVDAVLTGALEGFVLCTLATAKEGRATRDFFPQFFSHEKLVPLGPLKEHLDEGGIVIKSRRQIVSSHKQFGWHHTSAIKFHAKQLGHWFQMYNIMAILESRMERVFKSTVDKLAALRLKFTLEKKPVLAVAIKGVSNTSYGGTIRKLEELRRILVCLDWEVVKFRRKNTYVSSVPLFDPLDEDGLMNRTSSDHPSGHAYNQKDQENYYEVTLTTKQQTMKLPFLIGVSVLALSKMAFQELAMGFMDRFYRTGSWQPCYVFSNSIHQTFVETCRYVGAYALSLDRLVNRIRVRDRYRLPDFCEFRTSRSGKQTASKQRS